MEDSKKIQIHSIEVSPSHIINNLSISNESLYFIHNSQSFPRVIVIKKELLKDNSKKVNVSLLNSSERNEMIFIKSITLKDIEYIAIGLYNGFKLWNKEGNRLLFQISNPTLNKRKTYAFTCCSEFSSKTENNINVANCILSADNYGQLFLIYGSKSNWKSTKLFTTQNAESILSIGASIENDNIGITLDNGDILILKIEKGNCELMKKIEGDGRKNISINSVVFSKKDKSEYFLGCGFINGEIKIFSMKDYNIKFSINSNLRTIGPMIIKDNNEIITGSDDGQITIWKFDDLEDKIILKNNFLFEDKMIVGLAYDKNNNILYINSYDFPEIITISDI